jgi:biopolymer transport protein ExbD
LLLRFVARGNSRGHATSQRHDSLRISAEGGVFQRSGKGGIMAGIDVGGMGGRKRATNSEINMIPFIDLLMCTIAFLLITAVWVTSSSVDANAQVPGQEGPVDIHNEERTFHVNVAENDFVLQWKHGKTVVSEEHVPRMGVQVGDVDKVTQYPDLRRAIEKQWMEHREHWDASDKKRDQLVLHSDDRTPFRELIAVLDAANATKRDLRAHDGRTLQVPAFNTTFAVR